MFGNGASMQSAAKEAAASRIWLSMHLRGFCEEAKYTKNASGGGLKVTFEEK